MDEFLTNDTSPQRKNSLSVLVPEIRSKMPRVMDRYIYKLLFPLAKLGTCNRLLESIIQTELVDPMCKDYYTSGNFLEMQNYLLYLQQYGAGFYVTPERQEYTLTK